MDFRLQTPDGINHKLEFPNDQPLQLLLQELVTNEILKIRPRKAAAWHLLGENGHKLDLKKDLEQNGVTQGEHLQLRSAFREGNSDRPSSQPEKKKMKGCNNGHYFDPNKHTAGCPHCDAGIPAARHVDLGHYTVRKDFRYLHEPVPEELASTWVVGRDALAQELADRIMLSRGGAFLVSGLRGVGKTTCVRLAIHLIRSNRERFARLNEDVELVDVWINLARPLEPIQLLHHLIRHLYLRLKEMGLVDRLDPELRNDIKTAFLRTSFEISSRSLAAEERGRGVEAGFGKVPWLGLEFLGKISNSYKRSQSEEEALKYLPYDEKAAEFEIFSFSRRLCDSLRVCPASRWKRWWRRIRGTQQSSSRVKVVFVLDELDKLESQDGQTRKSPLDPVLQGLKTVFTASGFAFVFIGGKEVEERLLDDVARGDSIYESIFAYDLYLPCLWKDQEDIMLRCLEESEPSEAKKSVALYLRYKGRGVPRRTWRELNKHVVWRDQNPVLVLNLERRRYMEVFAKVEEALAHEEEFQPTRGVVDEVQLDRQRLCFYYTLDWVFARNRESFTLPDLTETIRSLNLGRGSEITGPNQMAEKVMKLLIGRAFIERADKERTVIGKDKQERIYRLAPWVLLAFQGSSETQWGVEEAVSPPASRVDFEFEKIGRFRVVKKIGEGGFGVVYKVSDRHGRGFAAKVLRPDLQATSPNLVELFEREIEALREVDHPGILRLYESGREGGRPYLITDLLGGLPLRQLIDSLKKFAPGEACAIGFELARIFDYIHGKGLVRLDIKPSNIFLTDQDEVKVIDLGIASFVQEMRSQSVQDDTVIGTPGYMAPEQTSGHADARADVFALGVVLYEMLTGQNPFRMVGEFTRLFESHAQATYYANVPLLVSKLADAIPAELDFAVQRALSFDPKDRFQTMEEFGNAIACFAERDVHRIVKSLRCSAQEQKVSREVVTGLFQKATQGVGTDVQDAPFPSEQHGEKDLRIAPVSLASDSDHFDRCPNGHRYDAERHLECPYCGPVCVIDVHRQTTAPGAMELEQARTPESAEDLVSKLRDPHSSIQESAFDKLCLVDSGKAHLLFDLARKLCLWGGIGAQVSKIIFTGEPLKMGRSATEVELPLPDASVSRQHVAFFTTLEAIEVEDLSSANGTFLNGERCRREKLSDKDILLIGGRQVEIHVLPRDRTITVESPTLGN